MEINLLDVITEEEYRILTRYRDWYAYTSTKICPNSEVKSVREILSYSWALEKKILYKLLGNNLILSKDFYYEKEVEELNNEIEDMICCRRSFGREGREGWKFIDNFSNWINENYRVPTPLWNSEKHRYLYESDEEERMASENLPIKEGLYHLINTWGLALNKFDYPSFSITLKDGKKYEVKEGCKIMKALQKIAESYDIEGFEDFRICHSLVHNQKKVKGEIHLSIHPLDYWTMSDNDCGWESCMSWMNDGGYKHGTVEMMNSPCVVVAYISSEEPMSIGSNTWNNKKWRQLFIVSPECILGIKSYPYFNEELSLEITSWLKELAETNLGWKYFGEPDGTPIKFNHQKIKNPTRTEDERPLKFSFCSNNMYTDVGACDWHPMYVGLDMYENSEMCKRIGYNTSEFYTNDPIVLINFNYSGDAQCMSCGEIDPVLESEAALCCEECQLTEKCELCGEPGCELYYIDGQRICEGCWNEYVSSCLICEEEHFTESMTTIRIRIPTHRIIDSNGYSSSNAFLSYSYIYVCNEHLDKFKQGFLKPGATIKKYIDNYYSNYEDDCSYHKYYVDVEDLNMEICSEYDSICFPYDFISDYEIAEKNNDYSELVKSYSKHLDYHTIKVLEEI
jgi:hypothetical protein